MRLPHASIPRNPLIADPMFLARYAEKAGSGILDMIARCREAGLPTPEFCKSEGQFIQALGRPSPVPTAEVTGEVTTEVTTEVTPEVAPEVRLVRALAVKRYRTPLRVQPLGIPCSRIHILVHTPRTASTPGS